MFMRTNNLKLFIVFNLFLIIFSLPSCELKTVFTENDTVFGTYYDYSQTEYYTLNEDYTWESHEGSGTFIYIDSKSEVVFTDVQGNTFSFKSVEFKYLKKEVLDENIGLVITTYYSKVGF